MHPQPLLTLAAAALCLAATTATALAQTAAPRLCHDHHQLAQALQDRYREVPVSFGLQTDGQLVQVFASPETGTRTILATRPDGLACILSAGNHYEQRSLEIPGPAAEARRGQPREG